MTDSERDRALQISLRLKAARYLAGSARVRKSNTKGKPEAVAITHQELAKRKPLAENRISANKLSEVEQMITPVTPSQIALIGEALGIDLMSLPMLEPAPTPVEEAAPTAKRSAAARLVQTSLEAAQARQQALEGQQQKPPARDRRKRAREGDA